MKHEGCRHIRHFEFIGQKAEPSYKLRFQAWRQDVFDQEGERIHCEACWRERRLELAMQVERAASWYRDFTAVRYMEVDADTKRKMLASKNQHNSRNVEVGQHKVTAVFFPLLGGNYICLHDWPEKWAGDTLPRHRRELFNLVTRWADTPKKKKKGRIRAWAENGPARKVEPRPRPEPEPSEVKMTKEERNNAKRKLARMQAQEHEEGERCSITVVETGEWLEGMAELLGRPIQDFDADLEKLTLDSLVALNRKTGVRYSVKGSVSSLNVSQLRDRRDLSVNTDKPLPNQSKLTLPQGANNWRLSPTVAKMLEEGR
jgi:hypothetical protein